MTFRATVGALLDSMSGGEQTAEDLKKIKERVDGFYSIMEDIRTAKVSRASDLGSKFQTCFYIKTDCVLEAQSVQ